MTPFKVLLIGSCGYWGPNILRNLEKIENIQIVCSDIDEIKLKKIENRFECYGNFYNAEVHAAIIATPINTHYIITKNCLDRGQHCLIQKPAVKTIEELDILEKLSQKNKLILMVAHTYVYHRAVQHIQDSLGSIGKSQYYKSTRINLGKFDRKESVIWDLAPHDASILCYLFPDESIDYISATGADNVKKGLIDTANITIKYKSGLMANIDLSWISAVKNRQIIIVGDKKTVLYDDCKNENKVCYYDAGVNYDDKLLFSYQKGNMFIPRLDETEAIQYELMHFFDCIRKNIEPKTGLGHIKKVTKMIEAANKSIINNGVPEYEKNNPNS